MMTYDIFYRYCDIYQMSKVGTFLVVAAASSSSFPFSSSLNRGRLGLQGSKPKEALPQIPVSTGFDFPEPYLASAFPQRVPFSIYKGPRSVLAPSRRQLDLAELESEHRRGELSLLPLGPSEDPRRIRGTTTE
jgi:hypothetical protein